MKFAQSPKLSTAILATALFAASGAAAQHSPPTLDSLLAAARENAAVLDEHDAKVAIANWQQFRANHAWTPKLKSDTLVAPVPANSDPWNFGNNLDAIGRFDLGPFVTQQLTVVVPIYTFGRIHTAQDLAELGVDKAKLDRELAARDLEFQVKRAYYSVRLSESFATLLGDGGKLIKDQLAKMDEARDFGDGDFDAGVYRQLQVFDAELDSRVADNELLGQIAREGLSYFTGHPAASFTLEPLDEAASLPALDGAQAYVALARQHRPELQQLEHAVRARELQARLERANFFPNIVVAANLGVGWSTEEIALRPVCRVVAEGGDCIDTTDLNARPYENPLDFFTLGIGLGMRWEIDFFQQYGKYREVLAQNDEVQAQRRRAVGAIELEITKLWLDAETARKKTEISRRRFDAARRWRDQFGLALQSGGGDMEKAVDPLKAFYESRALFLQARYDYLVARAALAKGVGIPELPAAPQPVNQSTDAASETRRNASEEGE